MIHPTRTNLLLLKEKSRSVTNSVGILKARRLTLIREFLQTSLPFLSSRDELREEYANAIAELALGIGIEGRVAVESLVCAGTGETSVEIVERSVMGLRYRDVTVLISPVRGLDERGYDCRVTTPHLEEALAGFEAVIAAMLEDARFESRLKRLGEEIERVSRRTRVLEERVLPLIVRQIRTIAQYLGEREREEYYRLKRFKGIRGREE